MRKWVLRAALLLLYCVPFAFLSVNGDAASQTMVFYALMVVGFGGLCWGCVKTNNTAIIMIGNALSFGSSCASAAVSEFKPMGFYFKPFTAYSLMAVLSVLAFICQAIPVLVRAAKMKRAQQ